MNTWGKAEVRQRTRLFQPALWEGAPTAWHRRWRQVLNHQTARCPLIPTGIIWSLIKSKGQLICWGFPGLAWKSTESFRFTLPFRRGYILRLLSLPQHPGWAGDPPPGTQQIRGCPGSRRNTASYKRPAGARDSPSSFRDIVEGEGTNKCVPTLSQGTHKHKGNTALQTAKIHNFTMDLESLKSTTLCLAWGAWESQTGSEWAEISWNCLLDVAPHHWAIHSNYPGCAPSPLPPLPPHLLPAWSCQ